MNRNTTESIVGSVAALLVSLCVGLVAGWPLWVTGLFMAAAAGGTLFVLHSRHYRRGQAELRIAAEQRRRMAAEQAPPPPPPPAPTPPSCEVSSGSLPSSMDGIPFAFSCRVHWLVAPNRPLDGHANPAALAAAAVVHRARQISQSHHPEDDTVLHALAASLGQAATSPDGFLSVWATEVRVEVSKHHREHLLKLADLRREQQVQERRIERERMVRAYLGDEVLTSVGSTVVWWLARNDKNVRETVDLIGTLAQLSAAANDAEVDELFKHLLPENARMPAAPTPDWFAPSPTPPEPTVTADSVEPMTEPRAEHADLLPDPDDAENGLFGHQLADLVDQHGYPEKARQVRERYRTVDAVGSANGQDPSAEDSLVPGEQAPSDPEDTRDWGAGG
ncbi:hypothetical protein [Amycolatopsis sp. Hca4]|uniref:hypothetical protein n=1 Tax=Amycolatopsis sp. Hca4 TaxID=2742131 RepID=UPI00158F9E1C|nr:hypothetical protein [Amycolatopsis sp. Hca4]QKV79603.1 hypothetical protein HUT10_41780 [Amycolatopsis sp. Hca4]